MEIIKDMENLKIGNFVLIQSRRNLKIRWVGEVDKMMVKLVGITCYPLFKENMSTKTTISLPLDWCDENEFWKLYKVTKKEKERLDKELILINL